MQVYISEIEYYYFNSGGLAVAFANEPSEELAKGTKFKKILLAFNEVCNQLTDSRMIIQKKY